MATTSIVQHNEDQLLAQIREMLVETRGHIVRNINHSLILSYWTTGKYIAEYELNEQEKPKYGSGLLKRLSQHLTQEFGEGFTETNLRYMRLFYRRFPNHHTLCDKLSWSHYRALLKVEDADALAFYINECAQCRWSVRQLSRQINTRYYERLLSSRDKETVRSEANTPRKGETLQAKEIIRDPYILEFIGIPQGEHFLESDLEQRLITRLQMFLLELGRGFTFVARQKRISFDNRHFYIDLVFYNILTRSYVLIDLKADELTHQDLGQMQMYVNYYTRELMNPGDNPPIGIVLCADKDDQIVKYTLPEGQQQIFAAQYMTHMPSAEELKQLLRD